MTGRPNPRIVHRDIKPEIDGVTIIRRTRLPSRRHRRLLELLVDLLDKPDDSGR